MDYLEAEKKEVMIPHADGEKKRSFALGVKTRQANKLIIYIYIYMYENEQRNGTFGECRAHSLRLALKSQPVKQSPVFQKGFHQLQHQNW